MPRKTKRPDPKLTALQQSGTLHRHPEAVVDREFQEGDFFDPRDALQVKYEMLRRVNSDGASVSAAARAFGFSRPAFYQAQRAFGQEGLGGLIPERPGPRRAHKLSEEVMQFVEEKDADDPTRTTEQVLEDIEVRFGLTVHRRSLERAQSRRAKKER